MEKQHNMEESIMVSEQFEFTFHNQNIRSGMKMRFKNDRQTYRFRSLFYDSTFGEEWLEVVDSAGAIKTFHPSKLRYVVIKRSQKGIIRESELLDY